MMGIDGEICEGERMIRRRWMVSAMSGALSGTMSEGSKGMRPFGRGAGVALGLVVLLMPLKLSAHQTQISDRVGGTHHIEPNDTPRAGEPSLTWFGLTEVGGRPIGLSDCDCTLVVYDLARDGEVAIATPPLSAIDVEGLEDVPSAELTFPQVGAYVLSLTGSPKGTADFPSFRLDFPVTVAAGQASSELAVPQAAGASNTNPVVEGAGAETAQAAASEASGAEGLPLLPIGGAVVLLIALGMFGFGSKR